MGTQAEGAGEAEAVVTDTGPVLHLSEADAVGLLEKTGDIHIPHAVDRELAALLPDWRIRRPAWLTVDVLGLEGAAKAASWHQGGLLGYGESEAICLALALKAKWLLTDDAAARLFAESLGLEAHGSLGVVLWAAATGHLGRADSESTLDNLAKSSLWVSARVLKEAKEALAKIFAQ